MIILSYGNTFARPDLELHDFCVDTADPNASIEAGTEPQPSQGQKTSRRLLKEHSIIGD